MTKKIPLIILASFSLHNCSFSQGTWTAKASLGTATNGRSKGASFEINGLGYIGTGYNGTAKNDFWQYDPTNNAWTQKANFGGTARYGAFGFAVNGFGYIGAGFSSPTYTKDVWKYNPTGNTWTQVANFGGTGRMDAASFVIGNKAYVGTGYDGTNAKNDFWRYNPTSDTWTSRANFGGTACCNATGFSANSNGYICLGRNASTTYYNTVYQYDTTANTWSSKATFPGAAREGAAAFVIANQAYVGTGGSNSLGTLYNDFYKYDPVGNAWSTVASFTGTVRSHTNSFSIGNYGYVGMGYTGGQVNSFYQYNLCSVTTSVTATSPSCNGGSNGSLNLTVTGATNPVTYTWSNSSTTQNITGLTAGIYSVITTDGNGCSATNTVTLTEPAAITNSVTPFTSPCGGNNSSLSITVSGGTIPYTYLWSNGTTIQNATGLTSGNYSVLVTDNNGCTSSGTITITAPAALSLSVTGTPATCTSCNDGTASATAAGGTTPFTYVWSTTPPQATNTATGLAAGNYTLCITDANGCTKCDTVNISSNNGIVEYNSPSITVYPNPSKGEFRILGLKTNAELSVYNCIGGEVYRTDIPRKQENVNITSLPYGIYLLRIKTDEKIFTKKITITK